MADITVTAAQVGRIHPDKDEVFPIKLGETVTAGQVLNQDTDGTYGIADANGSGNELQPRVVALEGGAAGQWVPGMKRGWLNGYTVSSANADIPLYLSNTAGALADSAGGTTAICGRVALAPNGTKVVYVDFDWTVIWA
jgi:hypothetical protein